MVKNINQGFPLFFFAFISNNLIYSKGCAMSRKPRKIVNIPIIFKSKKKRFRLNLPGMDAFQMSTVALRIDKLRVTKIALDIFDWLICLNIIRNFRLDEFISVLFFY